MAREKKDPSLEAKQKAMTDYRHMTQMAQQVAAQERLRKRLKKDSLLATIFEKLEAAEARCLEQDAEIERLRAELAAAKPAVVKE